MGAGSVGEEVGEVVAENGHIYGGGISSRVVIIRVLDFNPNLLTHNAR